MTEGFTSNDRAQDLIDWAAKINHLGSAIEIIANGDDPWCCFGLGVIIQDYAQAMEHTLSESYGVLLKSIGDFDDSEIGSIKRKFNEIKNTEDTPLRREQIESTLGQIGRFKNTISSISEMEKQLNKMSLEKIQKDSHLAEAV